MHKNKNTYNAIRCWDNWYQSFQVRYDICKYKSNKNPQNLCYERMVGCIFFLSLSIKNPFKVGELLYPWENLPVPSGSQSCQGNHIKTVDNNALKDVLAL